MLAPPFPIELPSLLIDERICRKNIRRMLQKAKANQLILRPHFKTHHSVEIGRWFREEGVQAITCSSLLMAEHFASDDWQDITVAFPVNVLEMDRINRLAAKIQLQVLVEATESLDALEKELKHPVGAFVKIDVGAGRSGILWDDTAAIDQLVQRLAHSPKVQFKGFLTHAGHSYKSRDRSTVQTIYQQTSTRLQALKDRHQSNWPHLILSAGDTPCFSQLDHFVELDEIRPGNFVFYDLMQEQIGSCTFDDIALVLACPVVARHAHRQELVLYGGAVHFSKEYILRADGSKNFGRLAEWTEGGWSPLPEDNYLRAVSQEHGLLKVTPSVFSQLSVGSVVPILPIHSCLSANLMPHYHALDGQRISK